MRAARRLPHKLGDKARHPLVAPQPYPGTTPRAQKPKTRFANSSPAVSKALVGHIREVRCGSLVRFCPPRIDLTRSCSS
eukprot:scaffold43358_cov60-Phaeocystis_antarctica.AAC.3